MKDLSCKEFFAKIIAKAEKKYGGKLDEFIPVAVHKKASYSSPCNGKIVNLLGYFKPENF